MLYALGVLMGGLAVTCFCWTDAGAMSVIAIVGLALLAGGLLMTHHHGKQFVSHLAKNGGWRE